MFPFSRSSAESSHPSETGKSLSEAFLDSSSRTRDTLPEQYRTQFDELRKNIFAFCKQFDIPVSTLSNKEAFGAELASKKIPPARIAEAVLLFQRLEHLVTRGELLKEIHPEYLEEAERLYHLREQYVAQVELLERVGILQDGAITGIDGKKYSIPTLEQIAEHLCSPERERLLKTKRDQGFTKLLLVPFGMSLDALIDTFRQFLLFYKQTHEDFDLDTDNPLQIWRAGYLRADIGDSPMLVYNPKSFDKDHHEGQTKLEVLEEQAVDQFSIPGWKVHLLQAPYDDTLGFRGIPRPGQGHTQGGQVPRPDLEAYQTPEEYLSLLQQAQDSPDSPYHSESGLTPEDWILAFMTHLAETGESLDDYGNGIDSVTCLIGVFCPSYIDALTAYWARSNRRVVLGSSIPDRRNRDIGARSSVMI